MLFQVEMHVKIPHDADPVKMDALKGAEKAMALELQHAGIWRHLWRHAGQYRNTSIFDVENNAALHDLLTNLPLYLYMDIIITPLCRHPSSRHSDDR